MICGIFLIKYRGGTSIDLFGELSFFTAKVQGLFDGDREGS